MNRRKFLASTAGAASLAVARATHAEEPAHVMTVLGPIPASAMGRTLPHEHILVDFIGAAEVDASRYDADEVFTVVLPHLRRLDEQGCRTLVECTPAFLGRDPTLLRRFSEATGVHVLTNTGYYGAANDKYLPPHAYTESASELARRWISEWNSSIDATGIRPGFIKIGVDHAPLSAVDRKLVEAAARTHVETGLTIAGHTTQADAAMEELPILVREGVDPSAFIWVHAQTVDQPEVHREVGMRGAWVEFDGFNPGNLSQQAQWVVHMKEADLLDRVLLSQDAGWYSVGEPKGGDFQQYTTLLGAGLEALQAAGITDAEVQRLTEHNPAQAFAIRKRLL